MTYKLNQSLLQKLRDGAAIDNTGNPNPALLKQVLRCAFPDDKAVPDGMCKYYYPNHENKGIWNNTDMPITNALIPLNDFIQKGVVVGYKVKPAFAWCAKKLFEPLSAWDDIADRKCTMLTESEWYAQAKALGVLDLWFDEVTEEPKEENPFPPKGRLVDDDLYNKLYHHYKINELLIAGKIPFDKIEDLVKQYDK